MTIKSTKNKPKILVILGPTASGKSALAVKLARKYNGEVISADSRQVYKGLNIGTGKITKKEMLGIPHHLLDIVSPKETFNVVDWKKLTDKAINDILNRGKLPIICGGTGFYIQSIVDGIVLPEVAPNKELRKKLETKNLEELVTILKKMDPERIKNIDTKNKVRLVRAIEIAKTLGSVPNLKKVKPPYDVIQIGLMADDEDLKKKIKNRLVSRIKKGMIMEALNLHAVGLSYKRMRELGLEYKFLADFLEKKITKSDFMKNLETEIWRYSKRQMTWFKRDKSIKWLLKEKDVIAELNYWLT
ncbi:MAG: tRNA (adenosine(37)-N6)-dimethylallyltransferase MiaA [Candidatus Zambryskibacteria bacterium]|nr:tRNA (adenosine(37)-N6)-dimethylallyltransferase MiaA [Candidatus Zambryskibacteria bacterium]